MILQGGSLCFFLDALESEITYDLNLDLVGNND